MLWIVVFLGLIDILGFVLFRKYIFYLLSLPVFLLIGVILLYDIWDIRVNVLFKLCTLIFIITWVVFFFLYKKKNNIDYKVFMQLFFILALIFSFKLIINLYLKYQDYNTSKKFLIGLRKENKNFIYFRCMDAGNVKFLYSSELAPTGKLLDSNTRDYIIHENRPNKVEAIVWVKDIKGLSLEKQKITDTDAFCKYSLVKSFIVKNSLGTKDSILYIKEIKFVEIRNILIGNVSY